MNKVVWPKYICSCLKLWLDLTLIRTRLDLLEVGHLLDMTCLICLYCYLRLAWDLMVGTWDLLETWKCVTCPHLCRVFKDCAKQLTDVLTDIFNTSLSKAAIPTCLKSTTIIPVPKKSPAFCLNDYRPITLTPIITKCLERLVMHNIKTTLPNTLDLL